VESYAHSARDYEADLEADLDERKDYADATNGDDEAEYRLGRRSVEVY
jgi:hypothetical protein